MLKKNNITFLRSKLKFEFAKTFNGTTHIFTDGLDLYIDFYYNRDFIYRYTVYNFPDYLPNPTAYLNIYENAKFSLEKYIISKFFKIKN